MPRKKTTICTVEGCGQPVYVNASGKSHVMLCHEHIKAYWRDKKNAKNARIRSLPMHGEGRGGADSPHYGQPQPRPCLRVCSVCGEQLPNTATYFDLTIPHNFTCRVCASVAPISSAVPVQGSGSGSIEQRGDEPLIIAADFPTGRILTMRGTIIDEEPMPATYGELNLRLDSYKSPSVFVTYREG